MKGETDVGGLRCSQVLERLSDFVDNTLPDGERAAVVVHVQGCRNCERFGGAFAVMVGAVRRSTDPAADERARSVLEAVEAALGPAPRR